MQDFLLADVIAVIRKSEEQLDTQRSLMFIWLVGSILQVTKVFFYFFQN